MQSTANHHAINKSIGSNISYYPIQTQLGLNGNLSNTTGNKRWTNQQSSINGNNVQLHVKGNIHNKGAILQTQNKLNPSRYTQEDLKDYSNTNQIGITLNASMQPNTFDMGANYNNTLNVQKTKATLGHEPSQIDLQDTQLNLQVSKDSLQTLASPLQTGEKIIDNSVYIGKTTYATGENIAESLQIAKKHHYFPFPKPPTSCIKATNAPKLLLIKKII